jgi:hypothetical protein
MYHSTAPSFPCGPCRFHLIPLQAVPEHLRAQVHEKVRAKHPEIHMPAYGIVQSDGYRPEQSRLQPPASLEQNVSRLMEMGIADRTRALQVCV